MSVAVFLTACYVHTRACMIAPVTQRIRVCPAAVRFFDAPSDVGTPYVEVAQFSVWWPPDMVADLRTVEDAERSKAAKLGANGIIRGRLVRGDSVQPRYQGDTSAVAIFIAADSAHMIEACAVSPRAH